MAAPRIVLVEDYEPLRSVYRALLEPELEVVAVLGDAVRLLAQVSEVQAEVVILDISLAGKSGFQAARELHEYFPEVKLIFLTAEPSSDYIKEAFAIGASGYVSKISAPEDLLAAVRAALAGERFVSRSLSANESAPE